MNILILALSGIGDALMFTPALKLIRKTLPDARIDALVMFRGVKDIYERNRDLNSVIFFDFMKEGVPASLKFLAGIRGSYDAAINVYPSNRKEYNIISFLTGAPRRAGVRYLRMDSKNLGWLNNIRVTENDTLHNVRENILLAEKLLKVRFSGEPPLQFALNDDDIRYAAEFLGSKNIGEKDFVLGFHPGCATLKNHEKRRWEAEKFAALAKKFIGDDKLKSPRVLIFGGPEEELLKEKIAGLVGDPAALTVNTQNLAQTAAIMRRCNLFISNDSSLMHVAAAMQLKTVAIIGPTNPAYIHPWKTEYRIASLSLECAPCFVYSPRPLTCFRNDVKFKCIKELAVKLVYDKAMEMIRN